MTIFQRILYICALLSPISVSALRMLNAEASPVYRQIRRAKQEGLIREITYDVKRKGKKPLKVSYLVLTPRGLRNLCEMKDIIPWVEELDIPEGPIRIIGSSKGRKDIVRVYLRYSTAAAAAMMIGAQETTVSLINVDSTPLSFSFSQNDDAKSLPCIVRNAIDIYDVGLDWLPGSESVRSNIRFVSGLDMKRQAEKNNTLTGRTYEVRSGQCAGMFCFGDRVMPVYVSMAHNILYWEARTWIKDLSMLAENSHKRFDVYLDRNAIRAILLIPNEETFRQTVLSKELAEAGKTERIRTKQIQPFGFGTQVMYAVPVTHDGCKELKYLVTQDAEAEDSTVIDLLSLVTEFNRNTEISPALFPLEDNFGTLFAMGIHLEVHKIRLFNAVTRKHPEQDFGVLCRCWQEPYYRAVLDERIRLLDIDDILNELNIRNPARNELKMEIEVHL